MGDKFIRIITLAGSGGLLLFALTQPCYCTRDCMNSVLVLLLGWAGTFVELGAMLSWVLERLHGNTPAWPADLGATLTWLANPLLGCCWITLRACPKQTAGLSLLATALSLSFLLFDKVIADEAGNYRPVTGYGPGYWLWVSSCLAMLAGSAWLTHARGRNRRVTLVS